MTDEQAQIQANFLRAASWYGPIDEAEAILSANPWLAKSSIHTAALLGDDETVKDFLTQDAANATITAKPLDANALVYLCFSKYLAYKKRPEANFLKAATALLDAGADANSGFQNTGEYPGFEGVLYGAAGVLQNAALTQLLLDHGADPNDNEACYHSPETWENDAMKAIVNTGKVTPNNLTMMLIRKHDFHDYEGVKFLLEYGADPNLEWRPGFYPIHHALMRANSLQMIELLLDHGADPNVSNGHQLTAIAHAACQGRGDILKMLRKRGIALNLQGPLQLIGACAEDDAEAIKTILQQEPDFTDKIKPHGGHLLARFATNGNAAGIGHLLDLGIDVNTPFAQGDGYWEIPQNSLAIHIAAWRGFPDVVKLLIERGSKADVPDAKGNTPLMLAVRACVDSYWTIRRSPDSVIVLLKAGADANRITLPTGYDAIDQILKEAQNN
ncbi:hypothetical protein BEL04_13935 [Mucilaginibacter sp. PPCGB 2223]|uniref:ankyrin repeat domain-containing protein n=1 Tax=Mucilaginibacter sp. PPCGB 2223 TaxID=1886027 RepID=UPI000824B202|nr:ankyrin repeat domain-containing protein [Mucilaginibacter sp. PPCGB 2223]OCX52548.1 hypothetical protein BEL04_13935 [Mucilaginibacter sp. PPCGB 2223]